MFLLNVLLDLTDEIDVFCQSFEFKFELILMSKQIVVQKYVVFKGR